MIRHTILFKLQSTATSKQLDDAIHSICELKNKLTGILSITAGECYFCDEKSTKFFSDAVSHVISIDFIDSSALDRFFKDPVTHPAKESIVKIAEGGYQGIIGFNFLNKYTS